MKKTTVLYVFCLLSFTLYSQIRIIGTLYDEKNQPLEGASVYINNTSIGTTTDSDGFFGLRVNPGEYQLIVSFVGYQTKAYSLDTKTYTNSLKLVLKEKNNVLNEVILKDVKPLSRSKRNAYLRKFQRVFLGESKFGRKCKVLNKEVLDYEVSSYDNTFEVYASEPIKILNPKLGYVIYYDLVHFKLTPESVSFFGYMRYEKIALARLNQKWKQNRLIAYQGSKMHFLRSVREGLKKLTEQWNQSVLNGFRGSKMDFLRSIENDGVKDQGFIVDNLKRIPNPERPSNKEIISAMEFLRKHQGLQKDPFKVNSTMNDKILEARKTLELAKLPEFINKLLNKRMILMKYAALRNEEMYLQFSNTLRVTYIDEKPDKNYNSSQSSSEYQVTMLNMSKESAKIHESGVFDKPYDVFLIGYWAFEKVGDLVPLDYVPPHKHRENPKTD